MNLSSKKYTRPVSTFAGMVITSCLLLACATAPVSPPGSAETRQKLTALRNDTNLAGYAQLELAEAETAVRLAEQPLSASEGSLGAHRVYMADRKVEIARAEATIAYTEDQRERFTAERNVALLAARTREADQARVNADRARADASRAQGDSYRAQTDANRARNDAALAYDSADRAREDASQARSASDAAKATAASDSARQATQMQQQIDDANRASKAADEAKAVAATDSARQAAQIEQQANDARQASKAADEAKAVAATDSARQTTQMQQQIDAANRASKAADEAKAVAATDAARQATELQRQIDVLEAEATDRGLVLTLGDVLFTTGSAELQAGATSRLDKLVSFLNAHPERSVLIEGHTDNVGDADYNQGLSQRRAESVQAYLARQGISTRRLTASGLGLRSPITSNDSAAGRQQNRRVEIIIENPPLASTSVSPE